MTIEIRPFASLGAADHGWLDTRHHFSFAQYHDPERMGWGALRVWNDDTIEPNSGFPMHAHRDMEIVTYVREGTVTHRDSLGNEGRTGAGDVQVMSAGTGIRHSEFNLGSDSVRLFQIWIMPDERGGEPRWDSRPFPRADRAGRFVTLASGKNEDAEALPIRADARVFGALLPSGESLRFETLADRHAYLVPASGRIEVEGREVNARDGVAITGEDTISITALSDSELVLVDTA